MPPLICASPTVLDQSFPRDEDQLRAVAITLGEIQQQLKNNQVHLVLTEGLRELVQEFDWRNRDNPPLLLEIYHLLDEWFLKNHERLVRADLSGVNRYQPHPIPAGCSTLGLVEIWSDEVGKLLALHDMCCQGNSYFIGIACEQAYSGSRLQRYCGHSNPRCFPLVGPREILQLLVDAYTWQVEPNAQRKKVSINNALKNYKAIGAIRIEPPSGGSHYTMKFKKGRSWAVDSNVNPIPDRFLSELVTITGYPLPVIRTALITGDLPRRVLRLRIA
jgi:hypothetical protein